MGFVILAGIFFGLFVVIAAPIEMSKKADAKKAGLHAMASSLYPMRAMFKAAQRDTGAVHIGEWRFAENTKTPVGREVDVFISGRFQRDASRSAFVLERDGYPVGKRRGGLR
ncbi:MAG TPA: hypothetical protein VEC06_14805 [Paucimonas sp.]|nr:hypothetical protein [Paucimonas sp.]